MFHGDMAKVLVMIFLRLERYNSMEDHHHWLEIFFAKISPPFHNETVHHYQRTRAVFFWAMARLSVVLMDCSVARGVYRFRMIVRVGDKQFLFFVELAVVLNI